MRAQRLLYLRSMGRRVGQPRMSNAGPALLAPGGRLDTAARPPSREGWVCKLSQGTYMTGETIVIGGGLIVR